MTDKNGPVLRRVALTLVFFSVCLLTGCRTHYPPVPDDCRQPPQGEMVLAAGDEVSVSFLGAPELKLTQRIRLDGRVSLRLLGEIDAAGKTVSELQQELARLYATQLQVKETTVVVAAHMPIFVAGAVRRPGRLNSERRITVFEAIMEGGGFDEYYGHIGKVMVIRQEGDERKSYIMDYRDVLDGEESKPFYLQSYDVVYVPRTRIAKMNQWVSQYINGMIPILGGNAVNTYNTYNNATSP